VLSNQERRRPDVALIWFSPFSPKISTFVTMAHNFNPKVFTHTEVDLDSSSVTCTPKNKKIKSLKKLFSGTTGYSFQMTVAVNMGKTGSSIKSAEITGIYRSNQTTKILVLLCYQNFKKFPSQMPQVLPPPPQQQQPQLQQQQQQRLQLKLILFLEIGLLFNTVDNMATLLIHLPRLLRSMRKVLLLVKNLGLD